MPYYCCCLECGCQLATSQLKRHYRSNLCLSGGKQPPTISHNGHRECIHCKKEFATKNGIIQHERTCPENINRKYKNGMQGKQHPLKGQTKITNKSIEKRGKVLSLRFKTGELVARGCCSSDYINSPQHKLNSAKGGGYRSGSGRSKKFKVYDSYGNLTTLQSSFELNCSEILAELGINWKRPEALKYDGRNYFADFYLPDFDVWLDPKNNYKAKMDEEKIRKVKEQNSVRLFILLENQITKNYILSLI